jgi:hypothetical protein
MLRLDLECPAGIDAIVQNDGGFDGGREVA